MALRSERRQADIAIVSPAVHSSDADLFSLFASSSVSVSACLSLFLRMYAAARGFDLNESGAIAKNGMNAALSSSNGTTAANSAVGNLANNVSKLPKLLQQQRAVRTAPTATVKTIAQIAGKKRKANSSDAAKPNAGKTASSDTDAPAVSPSTQHKSKKQRVR